MSLGSCLEYSKALKQAAVNDSWSDLYLSCQPILFPNQTGRLNHIHCKEDL